MVEQKSYVAVLFADVSDSTRLYESLGDTTAFGRVKTVIGKLKAISEAWQGRVVKTIGDGVMCVFPTADQAACAAGEMQAGVAALPPIEDERRLTIRIGYHFGQVIEAGEDVFGDSVNVAARMASLARAGQVLTTAKTVTALTHVARSLVRRIDGLPVKGKTAEVEVYEQLWQTTMDPTMIAGRPRPDAPTARAQLQLLRRGQDLIFKDAIHFGREPADDLVVIGGRLISRRHAKIELRGGKFVLVDQSSNGTYLTMGNNPEVRLHLEEVFLHGVGTISFGQSASEPEAETVEFRCP
jgi:adenylate cyclase